MKTLKTLFAALVFISFTVPGYSQNEPKPIYLLSNEIEVAPENYNAFLAYLKEYSELAKKNNGPKFLVRIGQSKFMVVTGIGEKISNLEETYKIWNEWNNRPEVKKLVEENLHLEEYNDMALWVSAPALSYNSIDGKMGPNTYIRVTDYKVKPGKGEELTKVIEDSQAFYNKIGVKMHLGSYWKVIGESMPLLRVAMFYQNKEEWIERTKFNDEKLKGNTELKELQDRFRKCIRDSENFELYPLIEYGNR